MIKREFNFEMLRVLSMLCIVAWHFIVHGIMHVMMHNTYPSVNMNFVSISNWLVIEYIKYLTAVGVNCYVLISGYFLIKSDFKFSKVLKIWIQTLFYSVVICVVLMCTGVIYFDIKSLILSTLIIRGNPYWFVTQYIALIILIPFLSKLALALTKRKYQILLLVLFAINVSLNFGFPYGDIYSSSNNILWFIFLFFVAAYIRLFDPFLQKRLKYGRYYLLFCLFLLGCYSVSEYMLNYSLGGKIVLQLYPC